MSEQNKVKHENNGACLKCLEILDRNGGTETNLKNWFLFQQKLMPDFHVSCAVRGKFDQEMAFQKKASRAHFGQSAHNYSPALAIDTFFLSMDKALWPKDRYVELCGERGNLLPDSIDWLGAIGSPFPELPHFEVVGWRGLVDAGRSVLTTED